MDQKAVEGGWRLKIRQFWTDYGDDVFLVACIILIALAAFGLGRYSVLRGGEKGIQIIYPEGQEAAAGSALPAAEEKRFVASLSGTKYHLPNCVGAKQIKEENKIWFATQEEAHIAGYEPATNCPGL